MPDRGTMLVDILEDISREGEFILDKKDALSCVSWRDDKLLLDIKRKADNLPLFMKILTEDDADKEIDATYKIHRMIHDKKFIEPIFGDAPRTYQYTNEDGEKVTCRAIVIERASTTLKDYFRLLKKMPLEEREEELFNIILNVGMGLDKLHKHIIHKDVKESNIMLYPLGWGIGDYGISSIADSVRNNRSTKTIAGDKDYLAYEIIESLTKGKAWHPVSFSTDVFALGAVFYKGLDPKNRGPYTKFANSTTIKSNSKYNPKSVLRTIEEMPVSTKTKYFLKRMLGQAKPEPVEGSESMNYRYTNIGDLLDDAKEWPYITNNKTNPNYQEFLTLREDFLKLMATEKTNTDLKGLIDNNSIYDIVEAYERLNEKFNTSDMKRSIRIQKSFIDISSRYNDLRNEQELILDKLVNDMKTKDDDVFICEKMYLWGPPFTIKNDERGEGKARYTYDETQNKNTHYHKKIGSKR